VGPFVLGQSQLRRFTQSSSVERGLCSCSQASVCFSQIRIRAFQISTVSRLIDLIGSYDVVALLVPLHGAYRFPDDQGKKAYSRIVRTEGYPQENSIQSEEASPYLVQDRHYLPPILKLLWWSTVTALSSHVHTVRGEWPGYEDPMSCCSLI
jgi:hypothetical protein